ncbi:MAG: hypothetical protein EOP52_09210 [Sphingobacteriales bacterium]|nr:MAG: hypothetical protein EOP52_09210 [Sphingobacteriales bacterium]
MDTTVPDRKHAYLFKAGIGFANAGASFQCHLRDGLDLVVSGGLSSSYLLAGSDYRAFKYYPYGSIPASRSSFLDFGEAWPALYLAPEIRHYFRSKKPENEGPFSGGYIGLKYRLSSRGLAFEESGSGSFFGSSQPLVQTYFRSTHKIEMMIGGQYFTGRKQRTVFSAAGGIGPVFNYNFSRADLGVFLDFQFAWVLQKHVASGSATP